MSGAPALTDTRDMKWVHDAFRRALGDAPAQIAAIGDGDVERAHRFASYLGDLLWLLRVHHEGEDQLLYPLLVARVPESADLFSTMAAQHAGVIAGIDGAQEATERFGASGSASDGDALAAACRSLLDVLSGHLTEEEEAVVPIAARSVTPEEWGAMPAHAMSQYSGPRLWLPLGLATEMFPDEVRAQVFAHVPPPVSEMWWTVGADAFASEMAAIRGTGS
ncbi:MAG TPA: hemerythrin domain-containing protein [Acidimicrobiales bacterium]|nr:hemerythrin domain-containing protein [Acidimicrobiales bacterium]